MLKPQKYLKSKRAVKFVEKYAGVKRSTAQTIVNVILANINDRTFSLGINGDRMRVFFNDKTNSLAVGIEDSIGGMFVMLDATK